MFRRIAPLALLLAGCATVPPAPVGEPTDPQDTRAEILAILAASEGTSLRAADPFLYSLADVVEVTNGFSLWPELVFVWNNPDSVGAAHNALAPHMTGIWQEWSDVLLHQPAPGWSSVPPAPAPTILTSADLTYLGAWKMKALQGFEYATDLPTAWVPGRGLFLCNKSGTGGYIDFAGTSPGGPNTAPTVSWEQGTPLLNIAASAKDLTPNAGNVGGIAYNPADGKVWGATWMFYNASALNNLGLWSFDPVTRAFSGGWRAGPANQSWICTDIRGMPCATWVDPVSLITFHANKTSDWVTAIPASWQARYAPGYTMACGRARPSGSLGGAQGPALYAIRGDASVAPGGDQAGIPLMVYPTRSATWLPNYNSPEGEDTGAGAVWVETVTGRSSVVVYWSKSDPMAKNWYGFPGPPCNTPKGWHAQMADGSWAPWLPMLYLYDPAELGEVALGNVDPWDVQPYEAIDLSADLAGWLPADMTCEGPFIVSMSFDAATGTLYAAQAQAWDSGCGGGHKCGAAIHAWQIR